MKRIISLSLAVLMLVTLLLTATSCELSMESPTGYTRLRDHLIASVGENNVKALDGTAMGLTSTSVGVEKASGDVVLCAYAVNQSYVFQVELRITNSPEKASYVYQILNASTAEEISSATATILLTHYTGNEYVVFDTVRNIGPSAEPVNRENATTLLNSVLKVLDVYMTQNMDMDLHELGFIALSEKYMAPTENTVEEEDLGGALSPAIMSMAGLMIVQGMGMVFLVLAVLWLVLLIFKKVFYKEPKAEGKPAEKAPEPVAAPVAAPAPTAANDALVAAITAAVAAYIESDPALASQFAGGFRVVSFKPTTRSRNR